MCEQSRSPEVIDQGSQSSSPSTITQILAGRAKCTPDQVAFRLLPEVGGSESVLTYGELDARARNIAGALGLGTIRNCPVLLVLPFGADFLSAFFGVLYAGGIAVPVKAPRASEATSQFENIVADTAPNVVLTVERLLPKLARVLAGLPMGTSIKIETIEKLLADPVELADVPKLSADTLAVLQYTSGSTSVPKGVCVTHGNLLHNLGVIVGATDVSQLDIGVSWLPHYHDMGLIGGILLPIYAGFLATLMSPTAFLKRPLGWLEAISNSGATISGAPNFAFQLCARRVEQVELAKLDLVSWRLALCGSEPIDPETLHRFVKAFEPHGFSRKAFFPCYGLAEATLMVSGGPPCSDFRALLVSADALAQGEVVEVGEACSLSRELMCSGTVCPELQIEIVCPEQRTRCGPEQVGEIWVRGDSVTSGYWNSPDEREKLFGALAGELDPVPYLRTGDLGFTRKGLLYVTGRRKDLIIIRGLNHYPQDIERTVQSAVPAFASNVAAAFSMELNGEERLVFIQEVDRNFDPSTAEEVFYRLRRAIAEQHGIHPHIAILASRGSIPLTSSGKVQRSRCRGEFIDGSLIGIAVWKSAHGGGEVTLAALRENLETLPQADRRAWLEAALISEFARIMQIDPEELDPFRSIIEYGLDSLQATHTINQIEGHFGIRLGAGELLDQLSIAALASHVVARMNVSSDLVRLAHIAEIERQIDELSDEEVAARLERELAARI